MSSPAHAATKTVSVRQIPLLAEAMDSELMAVSGSVIATVVNDGGDISISGRDITGNALWNRVISDADNQAANALSVDSQGDFWLAGSSSTSVISETATIENGTLNPDSVSVENLPELRSDLTQVSLWRIGVTGELKGSFSSDLGLPLLLSAMAINKTGISLTGMTSTQIFLLNCSFEGNFGNIIPLKVTAISSIVRSSDGSINLFGANGANGLLLKVNEKGKVLASVPSTAPKSKRRWLSSTSSFLLGGDLRTSKSSEVAITKFAANFKPTWTMRFAGDNPLVVNAGNSYYVIFRSKSSIPALRNWRPSAPTTLILSLDLKGAITGAYSSEKMGVPLSAHYSKSGGLYILTKGVGEKPISIFRLTSG